MLVFIFYYSALHLYRVSTRHTLLKVVNKLIPFSVIFFFIIKHCNYIQSICSLLNNLQISAHCRYTTWRNLTTSRKGRPKALGTANRIGWENNKKQKQWPWNEKVSCREEQMKLEVGIWRDFQPLFRKRARAPPRLFSGGDPRERRRSSSRDGNQKRDKAKD